MKKALLVIFFLSSFRLYAQTNMYHPFPDSHAVWNVWFNMNCFSSGYANVEYTIQIVGDTVINSQNYHKLNVPYRVDNSIGNCNGGQSIGYKGAIR